MEWSTPLVGRATELQRLRRAADRTRDGHPSAVLVHGEPGVGKTRLVGDFAAGLEREGFQVLRARCVRFAAHASSYLPITQAFGPRLQVTPGADDVTMLQRVGAVLHELMRDGPVALVVDDAQWADLSSLDVLTYLVAGFADGQRLLLLGTYRDSELGVGHPLHGWLEDLRRMPEVTFLPLRRFDRHDTELLSEAVLGTGSPSALVDQVFARSDGNAYLVELLLRGLEPATDRLPTAFPHDLREALLASWHRLDAPARRLMQVLAVGGAPVELAVLQRVAVAAGSDPDRVVRSLGEGVEAGLATVEEGSLVWFRHPLVAEVLLTTLLPPEAVRLHRTYAAVWESVDHVPQRLRTAQLALHCEVAGDASSSLTWSLHAADEARQVRGYAEEAHHLVRACRLWPTVHEVAGPSAPDYVGLLLRATRAAHRAGDFDAALSLAERAYECAREDGDDMVSCRVLNELNILRMVQGTRPSVAALQEAVTLSSGHPVSPEHVRALAELAVHEHQLGHPSATDHASDALRLARNTGSDEALAHALVVAADVQRADAGALPTAEEALAVAERTQDAWLLANATYTWSRVLLEAGRGPEAVPVLLDVQARLVRDGAPHEAAKMAITAADLLLWFGGWGECRRLLRDAMAVRTPTLWTRWARLTAAELAVRSGQPAAAEQHLRRAEELGSGAGQEPRNGFISATVDVLFAQGKWREAVSVISRSLPVVVHSDPMLADDLMVRAAAAAAQVTQVDGALLSEATATLDELSALRETLQPPMFQPQVPGDPVAPAYAAMYRAHRLGASGATDGEVAAWEQALEACDRAGLVWEAAHARYRLAEALVERRSRSRAGTLLREALRTAVELGAAPLRADIEALAVQAHLSLEEPERSSLDHDEPVLAGLTKREQEVLAHLVAGRTYAEIAQALFISEKTVGTHVSHLLQKTGTANRVQLSTLARRLRAAQPGRAEM